jgi:protein-S-isoprenylcysteine O-methyltransferase Ste14
MGLDIRWPIGLMFSIIGALLLIHGIATGSDTEMLKRSLGMNVNLVWGIVLLVFGLLMLLSAKIAARGKKATSSQTPANQSNAKAGQQPI